MVLIVNPFHMGFIRLKRKWSARTHWPLLQVEQKRKFFGQTSLINVLPNMLKRNFYKQLHENIVVFLNFAIDKDLIVFAILTISTNHLN